MLEILHFHLCGKIYQTLTTNIIKHSALQKGGTGRNNV